MKYPGVIIWLLIVLLWATSMSNYRIEPNIEMPSKILWAGERAEDLRFLDSNEFGVAFLAQTLILQSNEVTFRPRRQPLEVSPETYLIAVTRIETVKEHKKRPDFSDEQKKKVVSL